LETILLYDLFEAVKKDKRLTPIGTQQYFFLLELFRKNYPIHNYHELLFVCETLWLKSKDQKPFFQEIFSSYKERIDLVFMEALQKASASIENKLKDDRDDPNNKTTDSNISTGEETINTGVNHLSDESKDDERTKEKEKDLESNLHGAGEMRFSLGKNESTKKLNIQLKNDHTVESVLNIPYLFNDDYFPLNHRQLNQFWRNLTSRKPGSEASEVDFPASIRRIGQQGFIDRLLFKRETINQLSLIILIDQGGSMYCYEEYGRALVKSAKDSKAHPNLLSAFFYNTALKNNNGHYQFWNSDQTVAIKSEKMFRNRNKKDTVVIIFSDAGAAKGRFNEERVNECREFLSYLQQQVAYVAWINPMPKRRWTGTTAAMIAELVPMFETGQQGMTNAISVLRGSSI
jgi:uncharacterized protein with von Willebrand factor type A (vWA) domain